MKFATLLTPSSVYMSSSIFKYTTVGPRIPKEMKYNLHYGDLQTCIWPSDIVDKILLHTNLDIQTQLAFSLGTFLKTKYLYVEYLFNIYPI